MILCCNCSWLNSFAGYPFLFSSNSTVLTAHSYHFEQVLPHTSLYSKMIQIIKMEEKESIEKCLSFASGLAIQTGEHWNWKERREMASQGRVRDSLPSALSSLISLNHTKYNLNTLAYINFSGLHSKNTTSHHITAKSNSFTRLLNSSYHPDSPRLNRSLHGRLNIKHSIHRTKPWGYRIQPLSHPYARAEANAG